MTPVYQLVPLEEGETLVEPVDLATAAAHVRQDSTDDNAVLERLITVARVSIEKDYGLYLIERSVDVYFPGFGPKNFIRIPRGPLQSVTSVKYTDSDDDESTFASSNYDVDIRRGRVVLKDSALWPTATLRPMDPVVIRCVMGYASADEVPANIIQSMLLRLGHLYEHREEITVSTNAQLEAKAMRVGVDHLMTPDRSYSF